MAFIIDGGGSNGNGGNIQSRGEGRPLSEGATGATADASPEAGWSLERLSGRKVLVSVRVRHSLTFYFARPGRGWRSTLLVAKAETKREIGANSEEVK